MTTEAQHHDVVVATGLTRHFRSATETIRAVDDVSLTLRSHQLSVLAGRSGSGKSTLLNLLLAWDVPDSGAVTHPVPVKAGWAGQSVVPQGLGLLPELSARQNIEMPAKVAKCDRSQIEDLIDRLELGALLRRRPAELSLGEQQRVAVARALSCEPVILIADEPTAHQDERRARVVIELLRGLADRGSTVLIASHDDLVLNEGNRRFDLEDGRLGSAAQRAATS